MPKLGIDQMSVYYEAKDLYVAAGQLTEESTIGDICVLRRDAQRFSQNLTKVIERMRRVELRNLEKERKQRKRS